MEQKEKKKRIRIRHGDPRNARPIKIQIWLSEGENAAFREASAHLGGMAQAIAILGQIWPALDEEEKARLLEKARGVSQ